MSEEKKDGGTTTQEKKPKEWEWETPHGLVRLSQDIVRRYFCQDATEPEVMHFLAVCKYHKINPWLKEAYLIKYDKTKAAQIVVGKDFYNRRAQEFPSYKGHAAGIILQAKDPNGRVLIERRPGAFHTEEEKLLGGWAKVFRGDLEEPVEIEVEVGEYVQTRADGSVTRFWKEKPATMIRKVALSQAWREAFPKEFAGTLDEAEMMGKESITIDMPKSNAEEESSARPASADSGVEDAATTPADDISLEQEARAREQAESRQDAPKAEPPKTSRARAGELLVIQARKTGE